MLWYLVGSKISGYSCGPKLSSSALVGGKLVQEVGRPLGETLGRWVGTPEGVDVGATDGKPEGRALGAVVSALRFRMAYST